jgi:hypothetical protein
VKRIVLSAAVVIWAVVSEVAPASASSGTWRVQAIPGERANTRGKALDPIGPARTTGDPQPTGPRVIASAWWRGAG